MTQLLTSFTSKREDLLSTIFVYFDNRFRYHSNDGIFDITPITMHFTDKLSFIVLWYTNLHVDKVPLCLMCNYLMYLILY